MREASMSGLGLPEGNLVRQTDEFFDALMRLGTITDILPDHKPDTAGFGSVNVAKVVLGVGLGLVPTALPFSKVLARAEATVSPETEQDGRPTLVLIGDSLTVGRQNSDIVGQFAVVGVDITAIAAKGGEAARYGLKELDRVTDQLVSADAIVIALGTNPSADTFGELLRDVQKANEIGGRDGKPILILLPELMGDSNVVDAVNRNPTLYAVAEQAKAEGINAEVLPYYDFGNTIRFDSVSVHPRHYDDLIAHDIEVITPLVRAQHEALYPSAAVSSNQAPATADILPILPTIDVPPVAAKPSNTPFLLRLSDISAPRLPTLPEITHPDLTGSPAPSVLIDIGNTAWKTTPEQPPTNIAADLPPASVPQIIVDIQLGDATKEQDLPSIVDVTGDDMPAKEPLAVTDISTPPPAVTNQEVTATTELTATDNPGIEVDETTLPTDDGAEAMPSPPIIIDLSAVVSLTPVLPGLKDIAENDLPVTTEPNSADESAPPDSAPDAPDDSAPVEPVSDTIPPELPASPTDSTEAPDALPEAIPGVTPSYFINGELPEANQEGLRGETIPENIFYFYVENGITAEGAFGMMGNMKRESGFDSRRTQNNWNGTCAEPPERLDPGTRANRGPTRGYGFGLYQWTTEGRQNGLQAYADQKGTSWQDLKTQLEYSLIETPSYGNLDEILRTSHDIYETAGRFVASFERPWPWDPSQGGNEHEQQKEMNARGKASQDIADLFMSGNAASIEVACQ